MNLKTLKYCILITLSITLAIPIIGIIIAGIKNGVFKFFDKIFKGRGGSASRFIYGFLLFPGTVFHECAHALGAFLTGARVTQFSVLPSKEDKNSLGRTVIEPRGSKMIRSIQLTASATSPVFFGLIVIILGIALLYPILTAFWQQALFTYLFLAIFFHMSMSNDDVKAWIKGVPFLLILVFLIVLLLALLNIFPIVLIGR